MRTRVFAAALVAALTLTACQGAPGAGTGASATQPAKGQGLIKGTVTTEGVAAGAYRLLQVGGVAGASVQVQGGSFTGEVVTGADGSFSVAVPGGATYTVTASHSDGKGGLLKQIAVVSVPLAEEPPTVDVASLVTRRTGSIQGVLALAGGADPEGADVFVPGTTIVGKVSSKGRFALANLPEGTWTVVFQKAGYQRAALADLSVKAGRPLVISEPVTLEAGAAAGQLKGLVRDAQGRAIVGATVTATNAQGAAFSGTTDAQGALSLPGLADGTYTVQVYRPFYQVPAAKAVVVTGGAADLGTVTLASTMMYFGKVSGRLVDETGAPIDGAVVQLDPPVTESVFTDAQGNFTLDRVMPGEYTLRAAAGGFEVGERDLAVENRAGFTADLGAGFVLRQPFVAGKPKAADRPAASLLAPAVRATFEGDDLTLAWEPVGLPTGVSKVYYDLEGLQAPGAYANLATTDGTSLTLKGFGKSPATFNLVVRPITTPPAAGYRVAQSIAMSRIVSTGITVNPAGVGSAVNLQGMNLEAALMAVQTERTKMLDAQLMTQIKDVQSRNDQVAKLNSALGNLNRLGALVPEGARQSLAAAKAQAPYAVWIATHRAAYRTQPTVVEPNFQMTIAELDAMTTRGELDGVVAKVKSQIDSVGNSQQMDMLRLQSLSNKRNEAFEIMTNFIKKMADSRASILGNMR